MIRVVCTMLTIAIKNLEVRVGNLNLSLGKNAIWFKPLAQKGDTGKQTTGTLYYKY